MKAEELDHKFDHGEDIAEDLEVANARRPGQEQKRTNRTGILGGVGILFVGMIWGIVNIYCGFIFLAVSILALWKPLRKSTIFLLAGSAIFFWAVTNASALRPPSGMLPALFLILTLSIVSFGCFAAAAITGGKVKRGVAIGLLVCVTIFLAVLGRQAVIDFAGQPHNRRRSTDDADVTRVDTDHALLRFLSDIPRYREDLYG